MGESSKKFNKWTENEDVLLAREVLIARPYNFKRGTKESGNAWITVSDALKNCTEMPFIVSVKGTRDHFNLMLSKRQAKLRVEETATGGGDVETSELDVLMDEIKNDSDICQTQLE